MYSWWKLPWILLKNKEEKHLKISRFLKWNRHLKYDSGQRFVFVFSFSVRTWIIKCLKIKLNYNGFWCYRIYILFFISTARSALHLSEWLNEWIVTSLKHREKNHLYFAHELNSIEHKLSPRVSTHIIRRLKSFQKSVAIFSFRTLCVCLK